MTHSCKRRIVAFLFVLLVAPALVMFAAPDATACKYEKLVGKLNKLIAAYLAAPSPALAARICGVVDRMIAKDYGGPGQPIPPLPPGVVCGPGGNGPPPRGRGGAGGGGPGGGGAPGGPAAGAIFPPGEGPFPVLIFIRNFGERDCFYDWDILPDGGNPAGFSISPDAGTEFVPAGSTVLVTVDATISGLVAAPSEALFEIVITDNCTGLEVPDDYKFFRVVATTDISIVPNPGPTPGAAFAAPGGTFGVSYDVTNHTAAPVVKDFEFVGFGDPSSVGELNDGTLYDIRNIFDNVGPAAQMSGSLVIAPGATETLDWAPLRNGEYCDPNMLVCCGAEIDGNVSCVMIFNDDATPYRAPTRADQLVGTANGGQVALDVVRGPGDIVPVIVPTAPLQPIEDIIDQLGLQMLNLAQFQPDFHYMPVVDGDLMQVLTAPGVEIQPQSNDIGLEWVAMSLGPQTALLPTGDLHQLQAQVTYFANPVPGIPVQFQVQGANPQVFNGVTNPEGVAFFNYQGFNPGADFIQVDTTIPPTIDPGPRGAIPISRMATALWSDAVDVQIAEGNANRVTVFTPEPNPFTRTTRIRFLMPEKSDVTLQIFSVDGRIVSTVVDRELSAGSYGFDWDGRDAAGQRVPAGIYFARLQALGEVHAEKITLLK